MSSGSDVSDDDSESDVSLNSGDTLSSTEAESEARQLHAMVADGDVPAVVSLLANRRRRLRFINLVDDSGRTALHVATERICSEAIRVLLENGADRSICDHAERAPLDIAMDLADNCSSGLTQQALETLMYAKDEEGRTALHVFAELNNVAAVEKLLKRQADIARLDFAGHSPLVAAVLKTAWNAARLILASRHDAVLLCRCDCLVINDVSALNDDKFHSAEATDILNCVFQARTEAGAPWTCIDIMGNTPTHLYTGLTDDTIVQRREVNAQNYEGQTPLHLAINNGDSIYAKRLLKLGADVTIDDALQNTPLHYWNKNLDQKLRSTIDSYAIQAYSCMTNIFGHLPPLKDRNETKLVKKNTQDDVGNTNLHVAAGF